MAILNAAVIGPGGRARAHLSVLPKLSDRYRLRAVCDVDEERAQAVASEFGVHGYTDLEEMLDREKLDVCLIAVQAEVHHAFARVLAEHKIHILTETPIALTVPCANAMIEMARDNGVLLEVSENVRRWPHERLKRKIVESGLIGDIREFYLSYTSGSYHGMSGIRAILGTEALSVTGAFPGEANVRERGGIEWLGGIKGTYEYNTDRRNDWEITGSKGAIRGRQLHLYKGDRTFDIVTETAGEGAGKTVRRSYVETNPEVSWESHLQTYPLPEADHVAVADAWCSLYGAVVQGKELDYGGENGRRDVELLMGIRASATAGGKKTILPLKEITEYERRVHSEFENVYGVDILDLEPQHLKQKYDLPGRLRELMFYGRTLGG